MDAGLTQEELAEAAGLSSRSISDLERSINLTARRDTTRLLADALNLTGAARVGFEAMARGRHLRPEPAKEQPAFVSTAAAAATRTLPRDTASFTGREEELSQLIRTVTDAASGGASVARIHAIGGMAGVGKTTFAVHAAHKLASRFPDGQIFLPLHAHTPGQWPVEPAEALANLLVTLGVGPQQIPPGLEARTALWRSHIAGKRLLLLLDDAVGHEQVRPLLPGLTGTFVIVTSRRHLTALEDTASISLDTLPAGQAATLLIRLAVRPDIKTEDTAVSEITKLCGYLPLAIGMLARQLHHHPAWTLADMAAELSVARDRLAMMHAENVSVAAAFDLSYEDLTAHQQRLFRRLGLHAGPTIDAYATAALCAEDPYVARRNLEDLYDHHLLTEPSRGRYGMHDLIREFARALAATDDPMDCDAAAARLLDYYACCAIIASRHFTRRDEELPEPMGEVPAFIPELSSRNQAVNWLEAERANLHAAINDAIVRHREVNAITIPAALSHFLRTRGQWEQAQGFHQAAELAARQAGDTRARANALANLGLVQRLAGNYHAATATLTQALELYGHLENQGSPASVLLCLGVVQRLTVDYPTAASTLREALALYRASADRLGQAEALNELGLVYRLSGNIQEALESHNRALALSREIGDHLGEADTLRYLGGAQQQTGEYATVLANYVRALELYQEIGDRLGEAHALGYLGDVQRLMGDDAAASSTLTDALTLYESLGHRLGQAEVLNHLGDLVASSDIAQSRSYHQKALIIARAISALLEEAHALEGIANSDITEGRPQEAVTNLQHALEIYRRIGSSGAARVAETLSRLNP